jgi:hypothetical protein
MAIAVRSTSSVNYGSRTNTTIPAPAGIQNGDELHIFFPIGGGGTAPTPTFPAGFAQIGVGPTDVTVSGFNVKYYCARKRANGESGDYEIAHTAASTAAFMYCVSGAADEVPAATVNSGGITRAGDEMVRTALYEAANVLLSRITRFSKLKRWGMDVAKRRGSKQAKVASARKIGVILHRMWVDDTTYRWTEEKPIAVQAYQGEIRDASGPNRPTARSPVAGRGTGEAVTRPAAVIRRTTRI